MSSLYCKTLWTNSFLFKGPDAKKLQKEEQRKIDDAEELTEDEHEEKEDLLSQGINFFHFFFVILQKFCEIIIKTSQ